MTAATTTLTEFLLARIADDKRAARKLAETGRRPVLSLAMTVNHPERLLAECEAKRRIVTIAQDQIRLGRQARSWDNWEDMANQSLAALALPYSDHPDYREEWRP